MSSRIDLQMWQYPLVVGAPHRLHPSIDILSTPFRGFFKVSRMVENIRINSAALSDEQKGRVAKRAVDGPHTTFRGSAPFPLHQFSSPLNGEAGLFTRLPRPFKLRGHRAVAGQSASG